MSARVLVLPLALAASVACALCATASGFPPAFVLKWGTYGSGPGFLNDPQSLTSDASGNIFESDGATGRIQEWSGTGQFVGYVQGAGDLAQAVVAPDGSTYAVFQLGHLAPYSDVEHFTAGGAPLGPVGIHGRGPGQFEYVAGIGIDHNGNLYVSDDATDYTQERDYSRIQVFGPGGELIRTWGDSVTVVGQLAPFHFGELAVDGSGVVIDESLRRYASDGSPLASFAPPLGAHIQQLAVDRDGDLYALDPVNAVVYVYSPTGTRLGSWSSPGSGPGKFTQPVGIAVDASGDAFLLALNGGNPAILRFGTSVTPTRTESWGRIKATYR